MSRKCMSVYTELFRNNLRNSDIISFLWYMVTFPTDNYTSSFTWGTSIHLALVMGLYDFLCHWHIIVSLFLTHSFPLHLGKVRVPHIPTDTLDQVFRIRLKTEATTTNSMLLSFIKDTVAKQQFSVALLFSFTTACKMELRAFYCYKDKLFYVKPNRSRLTFDTISYRYCNSPSCTLSQNICIPVHLIESLA